MSVPDAQTVYSSIFRVGILPNIVSGTFILLRVKRFGKSAFFFYNLDDSRLYNTGSVLYAVVA